jgi:hypothetical protein
LRRLAVRSAIVLGVLLLGASGVATALIVSLLVEILRHPGLWLGRV